MDTIQIRRVAELELPLLQQLSAATFHETFAGENTAEDMEQYLSENLSPERLAAEWLHTGSAFFIAWKGTAPAGYLKLNTGDAQTEPQPGSLEIERIYVLKAFQGHRIGQQLMDYAIGLAREQHIRRIWLGVWERNHKAIRFYRHYGFRDFGRHVFRLGSDEQTDIMMELTV